MKVFEKPLCKSMRYAFSSILLVTCMDDGLRSEAISADNAVELIVPEAVEGRPEPGKRVLQSLPAYRDSAIRHALYLPTDWVSNRKYPLIVEYAGNGRTVASGKPCLGYGISGGHGFIWLCLPFVSEDHQRDSETWWGDREATVNYCKECVSLVCNQWGADARSVFLVGFSRGAIACNVIGLHDEEIAKLWRGMFCHSHYDDGHWKGTDLKGAKERLNRLGRVPQLISNEIPVVKKERIESYLKSALPDGDFTFIDLPFDEHTETWVLRDSQERRLVREWIQQKIPVDDAR
jgi:hypothetical protein